MGALEDVLSFGELYKCSDANLPQNTYLPDENG